MQFTVVIIDTFSMWDIIHLLGAFLRPLKRGVQFIILLL